MNINRLKGLIREHGKTFEEVGKAAGMNRDTFTRRMQSEGKDFKVSEILAMAAFIPLTMSDIEEIFFK